MSLYRKNNYNILKNSPLFQFDNIQWPKFKVQQRFKKIIGYLEYVHTKFYFV